MKHPATRDGRIDPEIVLRGLTDALLRGTPDNDLVDYDRAIWAIELEHIFGQGGRLIAALQIAIAEQEIAMGALEARLADLEIAAERRHQPYMSRSIGDMIVWVSVEMGLRPMDIRSEGKIAPLVMARQIVAWVAHEKFNVPFARIARALGNRDHSTIMTSVRRAGMRRQNDPAFTDLCDRLSETFTVKER